MRTHRLLTALALGLLTLAVAQCGGGSATSPSPTDSPAPQPSPSPSPSPSPGPGGSSLSVNPPSVQGQAQPQATVTLPSAAPAGGALVTVTSDNPNVVKVPASITVAGGSRSAVFMVDTATVAASTTVRITASYAGTAMSAVLTVTPPALVPSFVVRSRSRGAGACVVDENSQSLDCVFDGSGSQGFVSAYLWTYTMGSRTQQQTSNSPNSVVSPQGVGCDLYQQGTGGDGPNGDRYLRMEATMQIRDGSGVVSDVVRQQVRVYPNHQCGFSY
jgi:hypothetical protein